jgi:hypothetical protein
MRTTLSLAAALAAAASVVSAAPVEFVAAEARAPLSGAASALPSLAPALAASALAPLASAPRSLSAAPLAAGPVAVSAPALAADPAGVVAAAVSAEIPSAPAAAAEASEAAPAPAGPSAAGAPSEPAAPDLVSLKMPNGRTVTVARAIMDEKRGIQNLFEGPDGILLDLGPSEASFGMPANAIAGRRADWAQFSHDGRLTRLDEGRGGDRPGLVGGAARSVLVVPAGRARELGLAKGAVVAELGEGSSVVEVQEALTSGEWKPAELAEALKENGASEPRHFLDALLARFDAAALVPGPDGARAAELRGEVLEAIAKHPRVDAHLRMQAATRMFLDGMPRGLFRFNRAWPRRVVVAYNYADTWVHETGHQLVAGLVGSPVEEKRVFAHGAGFITTPSSTKPRQLLIDAAGGSAEIAVGLSAAGAGAALALALHGLALALVALPAAALAFVGLHMAYSAVAHAANDVEHAFGLLGWTRAKAFMAETIAQSTREGAALRRNGMTVPARVFYRVALRGLARLLFPRG